MNVSNLFRKREGSMKRHLKRIVGAIAATVLCAVAFALGTPATAPLIKITQTLLLVGAVVILLFSTLPVPMSRPRFSRGSF